MLLKTGPCNRESSPKEKCMSLSKGLLDYSRAFPANKSVGWGRAPPGPPLPTFPFPVLQSVLRNKESHPLTCILCLVSLLSRAPAGVSSALALHHPDKFTRVKSRASEMVGEVPEATTLGLEGRLREGNCINSIYTRGTARAAEHCPQRRFPSEAHVRVGCVPLLKCGVPGPAPGLLDQDL